MPRANAVFFSEKEEKKLIKGCDARVKFHAWDLGGEEGSGRRSILTMEPHWQKLDGHHVGVIEVEDSQELQI